MSRDLDIINKLAQEQEDQRQAYFLAPVNGDRVRLKLCNIPSEYRLPGKLSGWHILQISGKGRAKSLREATILEIREYVNALLKCDFVLLGEINGVSYGLQLSSGEKGFTVEGLTPINLVSRPEQFKRIKAGFDGMQFWYLEDCRQGRMIAPNLRGALAADLEQPNVAGVLPAERLAYSVAWERQRPKSAYDPKSRLSELDRIQLALKGTGANFQSYKPENQSSATVNFELNGIRRSVRISRESFQVVSAGICLSGKDKDFDITSLISVFKEADGRFGTGRGVHGNF